MKSGSWLIRACLCVASVGVLGACGSPSDVDCTVVDAFPWAFLVTVVDATSGDTLRAGISGEAIDEDQARSMRILAEGKLAAEVPLGTYELTATADGFETWDTTGVTAVPGACGGFTGIDLVAMVEPL